MSTFEQQPPPLVHPARRGRGRREWLLLAFALVLLAAAVLPPLVNIGRYQRRIASIISSSLGRPVHMRGVSLRALPSPGIVMTDFEVEEDPAFGAEPSLRAPSVVAQLRLASLWRGQLEVGRIDLDEASVNLVRDASGRWNAGAILTKAASLNNAPTAQTRPGAAPRFPYISATNARINFKQGAEKTPFSLVNADISMWLSDARSGPNSDPDQWQVRLEAQPVRTDLDLDLSDTGLLRVEGSLRRASALGRMPLALKAEWSHAPLGQMSRLVLGRDPGWRGDLHATAELSGDLDNLNLVTHFEVANMHRRDYAPAEAFALDTTCRATYNHARETLDGVACRWPVGDGELLLFGSAALGATPSSALRLEAHKLPASFAFEALRLARDGGTPSVTVEGTLDGTLAGILAGSSAPSAEPSPDSIVVHDLVVHTPGTASVLSAPLLQLAAAPSGPLGLVLPATAVSIGEPGTRAAGPPLLLSGRFGSDTYLLHWTGSAGLQQVAAWSDFTSGRPGLVPLARGPQGAADVDVTIEGGALSMDDGQDPAEALTRTVTEGSLRVRNARLAPTFLPEPVLVPAALVTLTPDQVRWSAPAVIFHKQAFAVDAQVPLECSGAQSCATHFDVTAARLDAAQTEAMLLGSGAHTALGGEFFDELLAKLDLSSTHWPALTGTVHSAVVTLGSLAVRNAVAAVSIAGNTLHLDSFAGRAVGGSLTAEGSLDVARGVPHYQLTTSIAGANASAVGSLFGDNWGAGAVAVTARLEFSGYTEEQLSSSAKGILRADWTHGGLPGATPLAHFDRWILDGTIGGGKYTLGRSTLTSESAAAPETVTGTIGFDRALALQVGSVPVTGTISRPLTP